MRDITSAFQDELEAGTCHPRFFAEIETSGGYLRYWTGSYNISWDGETWTGSGLLKKVDTLREAEDGTDGMDFYLAGEPSAIVSLVLQSLTRNATGKIWLGFLDAAGAVIADPLLMFSGELDTVELIDGREESTAILTYESLAARLEGSGDLRLNHETLQFFYSGDLGLEYVPQLEDFTGYWGKPNSTNKGKKKKKNKTEGKKAKKAEKQEKREKTKKRKKRKGRNKR